VSTTELIDSLAAEPFEEAFSSGLALPGTLDPNFEDALRHVLSNPGSLVRPRLVFQMATAYGMESGDAQDLAVALEYFHTASLLFDDLPCMDNALERRGAPCTHVVFGEDGAILTALALINRAYAHSSFLSYCYQQPASLHSIKILQLRRIQARSRLRWLEPDTTSMEVFTCRAERSISISRLPRSPARLLLRPEAGTAATRAGTRR